MANGTIIIGGGLSCPWIRPPLGWLKVILLESYSTIVITGLEPLGMAKSDHWIRMAKSDHWIRMAKSDHWIRMAKSGPIIIYYYYILEVV